MANEFARNIQDATYVATAALPSTASTFTAPTPFDLGADVYKTEAFEVSVSVPALSATIVPNASTVTYSIETSASSGFGTIVQTLSTDTFTASGGTGVAAFSRRVRVPADCARYLRAKVAFGASTTTGAALSATVKLLF